MAKHKKIIVSLIGLILFSSSIATLTSCNAKIHNSGDVWDTLSPAPLPKDNSLDAQVNRLRPHIATMLKQQSSLTQTQVYRSKNTTPIWNQFFSNKLIPHSTNQEINHLLSQEMAKLPIVPLNKDTLFINNNHQYLGKYEDVKVDPNNIVIHGLSYRRNRVIEMQENDYLGFGFGNDPKIDNYGQHFLDQFNYDDTSFLSGSPTTTINAYQHYKNNLTIATTLKFVAIEINGQKRILSLPHFSQNDHYDINKWSPASIKAYFKNCFDAQQYPKFMKNLMKAVGQQNSIFNQGPGSFLQYLMPLGYWELKPVSHNIIIMECHSDLTPFGQTAGQLLYKFNNRDKDPVDEMLGPFSIVNSHDKGNLLAEEAAWYQAAGPLIGYWKPRKNGS